MKAYTQQPCKNCDGKGVVRKVGYTAYLCASCDEKGFTYEEISIAELIKKTKKKSKMEEPKIKKETSQTVSFSEFLTDTQQIKGSSNEEKTD